MAIPTDILNIVDQVMALAKRNESIVKLAEILKNIGSLDQAARETETRLERLRQEQVTEQAALATLQERKAGMEGAANAIRLTAEQQARDTARDAVAAAKEIETKAEERAAAILAAARTEAETVRQRLAAATAEHKAVVTALRAEAAEVERAIPAAKAVLADIEARITEAKAQARRLLG